MAGGIGRWPAFDGYRPSTWNLMFHGTWRLSGAMFSFGVPDSLACALGLGESVAAGFPREDRRMGVATVITPHLRAKSGTPRLKAERGMIVTGNRPFRAHFSL